MLRPLSKGLMNHRLILMLGKRQRRVRPRLMMIMMRGNPAMPRKVRRSQLLSPRRFPMTTSHPPMTPMTVSYHPLKATPARRRALRAVTLRTCPMTRMT